MSEIFPALCAGIVSTIVCNPLDVIRINYQIKNKINYNIYSLYKGLNYGIIAIPFFWSIYFPTYKTLKDSNLSTSISSYTASCISSTLTTPFWVLKQRVQTNKKINDINLYNLYKGLIPTYIINLSFTVQMPIYEYLKNKTDTSTLNTFLNTSISKTISSLIFYPFDTIRVKIRNGEIINFINIKNYYRGINLYLLRSIPYHTSLFCTYEYIKNLM